MLTTVYIVLLCQFKFFVCLRQCVTLVGLFIAFSVYVAAKWRSKTIITITCDIIRHVLNAENFIHMKCMTP